MTIGAATMAMVACAQSATALPQWSVGGGSDCYAGPGGERLTSLLGFVAAGHEHASFAAGGLRYDDNRIGTGDGIFGTLGAEFAPVAVARAWVTRFVGDGSFRAWRLKAGPELTLRRGTLGLFLQRDRNNIGGDSDGAIAELAVPCAPRFVARLNGGFASGSGVGRSSEGTLGFTWRPASRYEISVDAGLARNGAFESSPIAAQRRGGGILGGLPPILGPPDSSGPTSGASSGARTAGVVNLGLRAYFP